MEATGAVINGRQRMEVTGALSIVVGFVALAGSYWALSTGNGIAAVLSWTVGANLLGAILHAGVLWRWALKPRVRWNPPAWRASLIESYPFALTAIIAMAYTRLDLVLLSLWQGEVVAGWYSAAYKLWQTVGLLPASVLDAMFPEMSRLAEGGESLQHLSSLIRKSARGMVTGGVVLAVGGVVGAQTLITLVYGQGEIYSQAVPVFQLLVCAIPAMFLYLLGGHTLYALGEQRRVTGAMWVAGLTNVGLNIFVIPRWGGLGAGAVALLSEWLLLALLIPQARRALRARQREDTSG
jgi:O-antigen/teichoic acid export membrane protein